MIYYSCGLQKSTFVGGSYLREFNFILYKYFWVGLSIIYIWIEKKVQKNIYLLFPHMQYGKYLVAKYIELKLLSSLNEITSYKAKVQSTNPQVKSIIDCQTGGLTNK